MLRKYFYMCALLSLNFSCLSAQSNLNKNVIASGEVESSKGELQFKNFTTLRPNLVKLQGNKLKLSQGIYKIIFS